MPVYLNSAAIRAAFWRWLRESNPALWRQRRPGRPQNAQPCDIRAAWCDWVDAEHRAGNLSDRQADSVTL